MTFRERLLAGEILSVAYGDGVGFDVWVEKYANPPRVYAEGRPHPLEELEGILARVERHLDAEGVMASWNGPLPVKPADA